MAGPGLRQATVVSSTHHNYASDIKTAPLKIENVKTGAKEKSVLPFREEKSTIKYALKNSSLEKRNHRQQRQLRMDPRGRQRLERAAAPGALAPLTGPAARALSSGRWQVATRPSLRQGDKVLPKQGKNNSSH